jgi:hypothetical protein
VLDADANYHTFCRNPTSGRASEAALEFEAFHNQCPTMNQSTLLRESRSKHTLRNSDAAAKQLRVFKAVLPITSKKSVFSANTPAPPASSSASVRKS